MVLAAVNGADVVVVVGRSRSDLEEERVDADDELIVAVETLAGVQDRFDTEHSDSDGSDGLNYPEGQ